MRVLKAVEENNQLLAEERAAVIRENIDNEIRVLPEPELDSEVENFSNTRTKRTKAGKPANRYGDWVYYVHTLFRGEEK